VSTEYSVPSDASIDHPDPDYYREFRKVKNLFGNSATDIKEKIAQRAKQIRLSEYFIKTLQGLIFNEKGQASWQGLPLPRTDFLENGAEYY
jgi:hypothetical protein